LPARTRDIFVLFRLDQLKQSEIAARMGISVSAVEKHVVRAVAHLARRSK
jgi:RNA polymerase sigma-70 factor (ECF subfamily)